MCFLCVYLAWAPLGRRKSQDSCSFVLLKCQCRLSKICTAPDWDGSFHCAKKMFVSEVTVLECCFFSRAVS